MATFLILVCLWCACAVAAVSDFALDAHGVGNRRVAFAGRSGGDWLVGTGFPPDAQNQLAPFNGAQCGLVVNQGSGSGQASFLITQDGTLVVELSCTSYQTNGTTYWLMAVNATTGQLVAKLGYNSTDYESPFHSAPAALSSGNEIALSATSLGPGSSGILVLDSNLREAWRYVTCHGSFYCNSSEYAPGQIVAASGDLIFPLEFENGTDATVDLSIAKRAIVGKLPFEEQFGNQFVFDTSGKALFVPSDYGYDEIYRYPVPPGSGRNTTFRVPEDAELISASHVVSDSKGRVFLSLSFENSYPAEGSSDVVIAYRPNGKVLWKSENMSRGEYDMPMTQTQIVITDDESLVVFTVYDNYGESIQNGTWWSAAFDTTTGHKVWNISHGDWKNAYGFAPLCTTAPVPMSDQTLVYECQWDTKSGEVFFYAVDHTTGKRRNDGHVKLETRETSGDPYSGGSQTHKWDSNRNLFVCGTHGDQYLRKEYSAWCLKSDLSACLVGSTSCTVSAGL